MGWEELTSSFLDIRYNCCAFCVDGLLRVRRDEDYQRGNRCAMEEVHNVGSVQRMRSKRWIQYI